MAARKRQLARSRTYNANLRGADLCGANLGWADLSGTELRGANLSGARIERADFSETAHDSTTRWPVGFKP